MAKIKLAEALLMRKELGEKIKRLKEINKNNLFVVKTGRKQAAEGIDGIIAEGIDEIIASVPKISMHQVTHAYDWHTKNLRLVDGAIQQANWSTEVELPNSVMEDFVDPYAAKV